MGIGWPLVVLIGLAVARKLTDRKTAAMPLEPSNRVELVGFLMIAGVIAFIIPLSGHIDIILGAALLAWLASASTN
jgi:cation:H+ antiporter